MALQWKGHEAVQKSLLLFWTFAHCQILVLVPVISGTSTMFVWFTTTLHCIKNLNNLKRNGCAMKRPWSQPKILIAVLDFCALPDSCVRASHFRHRHYSHTVAGRCRHARRVEWCWSYHSYTCLVVRISYSAFAISSTIDSSIMPLNKTSTTHSKPAQ